MQATPPFYQLDKQFRAGIARFQLEIEARLYESIEIQQQITTEPLIRLQDQFQAYMDEKVFPTLQHYLSSFIDRHNAHTQAMPQINKNTATQMMQAVAQAKTELLDALDGEKACVQITFKVQTEKIHLLLLYKQNDIHEDFEQIFAHFRNAEEDYNQKMRECVKAINLLAYENQKFATMKEQCIKTATQLQDFGDEVYQDLQAQFRKALDDQHERLNSEICKQLDLVCGKFIAQVEAQIKATNQAIQDKMMMKIDENVLIRINQSIEKTEAFAMSQMPDVEQIKNHLNCLVVIIRNSRKLIAYEFYVAIYELAGRFITEEDGLFAFVSEQQILPIANVIPNFAFLAEYFAIFHRQFAFTADQLIQAMVHELALQFSPAVEKHFVLFLQKFYLSHRSDRVPRVVCERYGTLKKQRINIMDQPNEDLEVGFAYFYLSVIAQVRRCEMVQYSQITDITAQQLLEEQQFYGTFRLFQPARGKTYRCCSPGWMYMDQRNEIEILVEPHFECTEDV